MQLASSPTTSGYSAYSESHMDQRCNYSDSIKSPAIRTYMRSPPSQDSHDCRLKSSIRNCRSKAASAIRKIQTTDKDARIANVRTIF
ncbi:MAG: hypothetical protein ACOX4T_04285 [Acetivibrionales bacterium]